MSKFLLAIFFLMIVGKGIAQSNRADWHFAYWMPYDNNLNNWADSIMNMVGSNISTPKVTATVQVDRQGAGGMERFEISNKLIRRKGGVLNDHSWNAKALEEYLKWVSENYLAEKYAVIFLDHGGKLDEGWMNIP